MIAAVIASIVIGQVELPGSRLSLAEASSHAQVILVAKIVEREFILGSGASSFGSVSLEHSLILKGRPASLASFGVTASSRETFPKQGVDYIYFINEQMQLIKVLPKTDENIAQVNKCKNRVL